MSRAAALKRLMMEYKQLVSNGSPDGMFTAGPVSEDDFFTWEALIEGPKDTPFEGGVFLARLTFVSAFLRTLRNVLTNDNHFRYKSHLIILFLRSK
jgi:ubiquitin-protein ligase